MNECSIDLLRNFIIDKKSLHWDTFCYLRNELESIIKLDFIEQDIPSSLKYVIISISNLCSNDVYKKCSDPEFIFQLGAFYALTNILDSDLHEKEKLETLNKTAEKLVKDDVLFDMLEKIKFNPDIKKSELEELFYETGRMGYGDFTSVYADFKKNAYMYVRISINEEYLYLTPLGEQLYDTTLKLKNGD